MVGRIARYRGDNPWQDMAAPEQPADARSQVVASLAQDAAALPTGATPGPSASLFGAIAGRSPAPNRSGQRLGKSKVASAAESDRFKSKLAKTGSILWDMSGLDHIASGQYLKDAGDFGTLSTPGTGTGWDGANTPAEDDRMTDIAGAYGQDALNVALGSSPFSRPANSVGMFGGRKAKTYPHDMEAKALDMIRNGHSVEEARQATGIDWDAAGNPRYEISDHNMKITPDGEYYATRDLPQGFDPSKDWHQVPPASHVMQHDELFAAYPELQDHKVHLRRDNLGRGSYQPRWDGQEPAPPIAGAYGPRADVPQASINGSMEDVLVHELQHAVQQIEGNKPQGTNPRHLPVEAQQLRSRMAATEADLRGVPPTGWKLFPDDMTLYRSEGGENEANAAKYRRTLEPAIRQGTPVQSSLPRDPQRPGEEANRALQWGNMPDGTVLYPARTGPRPELLNPPPASERPTFITDANGKPSADRPAGFADSPATTPPGKGGKPPKASAAPQVFPELGDRYPAIAPGTPAIDKVTGKAYLEKTLSPEAEAFDKVRGKVVKDVKKGGYEPYFDPTQRQKVDPTNYPRSGQTLAATTPKKAETIAKYEAITRNPEATQRLQAAYDEGNKHEGAGHWYWMKQLEDEFVHELGPDEGRKGFEQWARTMAQTTGGADPTGNFLAGHYVRVQRAQGLEGATKSTDMPYPVGGRYMSGNMELANKAGDKPFVPGVNPKRHNFESNFLGHDDPTIDEVMMRGFDPKGPQMPDFYGPYEAAVNDLAKANGEVGSEFQDKAWAGMKRQGEAARGKEPYTPMPMIQIVNDAIERTARLTGKSPRDVVRQNLVRAKGPMYGISGLMAADQIRRAIQQQDNEGDRNAY